MHLENVLTRRTTPSTGNFVAETLAEDRGVSSEINQLDLTMKIQGALLRKVMDQQAQNILKLVRSVTENDPQAPRGRDDRLGRITDVTA